MQVHEISLVTNMSSYLRNKPNNRIQREKLVESISGDWQHITMIDTFAKQY